MRLHTHFPPFEKGRAAPGLILCLCGAFPASPLCAGLTCHRRSPRTELLLIYRIQSHTHPKRRKFCLKHAGQKSVKEELPEQRKGPKRAVECWLKVQTHVWDHEAAGSSPVTSTTKLCLDAIRVPGAAFSFTQRHAFLPCASFAPAKLGRASRATRDLTRRLRCR